MLIPKNDLLSEQSIIWTLLIDKQLIPYILSDIREEYFYIDENKIIFRAIKDLVNKWSDVDLVILKNALESQDISIKLNNWKQVIDKFKKENLLEQIWWLEYLVELTDAVINTGNIKDYCKILKENYVLREYQKLSSYIITGLTNNLDTASINDLIEKQLKSINSLGIDDKIDDMKTIMLQHYDSLVSSLEWDNTDIKRVKTWFVDIDKAIWSLHWWDLVIIAASSSIWKTMFGLNLLNNITCDKRKRWLLFTMEMNKNKISDILITMNSGIKYQTLQTWNDDIVTLRNKLLLAQDRFTEWIDPDNSNIKTIEKGIDKLVKLKQDILIENEFAIADLMERNLFIDDRSWTTVQIVRNKIMELSIKDPLDIVVIDQLSLMWWEWKMIRERYDIITWELKQIAREYNVPIVLIVQLLWKELGKRPGHVPRNDDIKESFKIYEDADKVFLLNRPLFWAQEDGIQIDEFTDKSMHVYITKNRWWNTTDVTIWCDITQQKLYNASTLEKSLRKF